MIEEFRRVAGLEPQHDPGCEADRWRVLLVHAHPDDETLATGALIVALVAAGVECAVVTATRGEMGEVVPGAFAGVGGTDDLVARREDELAGAVAALGVTDHAYLGTPPARVAGRPPRRYRDSGMRWVTPTLAGPSLEADARSLTEADVREVAADLAAAVAAYRPDVVVTYDAGGGYGHPDHVRIREATLAALAGSTIPILEVLGDRTPDGPSADPTPAWFDLPETLSRVRTALRAHATQLTVDGGDVVHVGGQREPILTSFGLRRV